MVGAWVGSSDLLIVTLLPPTFSPNTPAAQFTCISTYKLSITYGKPFRYRDVDDAAIRQIGYVQR